LNSFFLIFIVGIIYLLVDWLLGTTHLTKDQRKHNENQILHIQKFLPNLALNAEKGKRLNSQFATGKNKRIRHQYVL
jgi:hypothetical protein